MFNILGEQYPQVMVMAADGLIGLNAGHRTDTPPCLGTPEIRKTFLDAMMKEAKGDGEFFDGRGFCCKIIGRTRCPDGCHELLLAKDNQRGHLLNLLALKGGEYVF